MENKECDRVETLIMYYSYTGTSRKEANRLANVYPNSIVCEVKEKKKKNLLKTIFVGCPKAMLRGDSNIDEIGYDPMLFQRIVLVAPVWAGYPAPAFNSMLKRIPEGKEVEVFLCSSGGETPKSKEGTCQLIRNQKCELVGYHDIKG